MKVVVIANSASSKCSSKDFEDTVRLVERHYHGVVGTSFAENSIDAESLGNEHPDFAIVIGGDGTIISACHHFGDLQVPILGVNFGKLGYLAHFTFDQLEDFFEKRHPEMLPTGRFISQRMLLQVEMGARRFVAVNDLVVDIGPPFRAIELKLSIDDKKLPLIRGDGVIIATPTGSTAYTLSIGGPVIHPEVHGIAVTPKNPHRLSFRPLVIRDDSKVFVVAPEEAYFIVDGQQYFPCTECDEALVSRFHQNFKHDFTFPSFYLFTHFFDYFFTFLLTFFLERV